MVDIKCECIDSSTKSIIRLGAAHYKDSLEKELKVLEDHPIPKMEDYKLALKSHLLNIGELVDKLDEIPDCD